MSSKNASKLQQEEPVKKTPPTASGKDCNENEIDALFSSFNRPSNSTVSKKKGKGKQKGLEQKRRKIVKEGADAEDNFNFSDSRGLKTSGRKYIDGLPVYTADELGIGKGGDTKLCPFDCDCCF